MVTTSLHIHVVEISYYRKSLVMHEIPAFNFPQQSPFLHNIKKLMYVPMSQIKIELTKFAEIVGFDITDVSYVARYRTRRLSDGHTTL